MSESNPENAIAQSAIRDAAKTARASMTIEQRRIASNAIAENVFVSDLFREAKRIACFVPMQTEVDTWSIIKRAWDMKKRIFAPVTGKNYTLSFQQFDDENELFTNKMGLQEPLHGQSIEPEELDLVLMPLVAFDAQLNRIGMGGGYYDRAFSFLADKTRNARPALAGLAYDCQITSKILRNPWDIRLSSLFTESQTL